LDPNSDGKVHRVEATGQMKISFERNDLDHDGYIDRSEIEGLAQRLANASLSK